MNNRFNNEIDQRLLNLAGSYAGAAKLLGVSTVTIWRWRVDNSIPPQYIAFIEKLEAMKNGEQ